MVKWETDRANLWKTRPWPTQGALSTLIYLAVSYVARVIVPVIESERTISPKPGPTLLGKGPDLGGT